MKTILLTSTLAAMMAGSVAMAHAEASSTRVLVSVSNFGDFMGSAPADKCTAQRNYYYNDKMQVVAVIETATNASGNDLYTQYYNPYIYDEAGNLVKKDRYQYGLYDYGDRAMHQAAGVVEYKYDAEGNCIEQIENQSVIAFEYDAEGNCVREVHYNNGKETKTLIYSDFSAGRNKPALVSSTHVEPTYTGEFYDETREYDELGQLVKAQRLCNRDYVDDHGFWSITTAAGDFMQEEHWTYDGEQIMLYEKFMYIDEETGELQPYLKTVYTKKDENVIGLQSYTAFGGEWYKSGVYQEETYRDFAGMTEATAIELVSVSKSESDMSVNGAELVFTCPAICESDENVTFNIFRNGELLQLGKEQMLADLESGYLGYADPEVPSGQYDYMVQTVTSNGDFCVSNIMSVDLTMELPAASNIRAVASEKNDNNDNYVTILFKAPEVRPELGFISNDLIVGNAQVGEDHSEDPTKNVMHCTIGDNTATVFILTRYKYGHALSERVTIDVNNLSSLEELRTVATADMMVFDLNGRQVNAPLEELHGSFIVVTGKTAHKVVLK